MIRICILSCLLLSACSNDTTHSSFEIENTAEEESYQPYSPKLLQVNLPEVVAIKGRDFSHSEENDETFQDCDETEGPSEESF